jgi:hypothetical protein
MNSTSIYLKTSGSLAYAAEHVSFALGSNVEFDSDDDGPFYATNVSSPVARIVVGLNPGGEDPATDSFEIEIECSTSAARDDERRAFVERLFASMKGELRDDESMLLWDEHMGVLDRYVPKPAAAE